MQIERRLYPRYSVEFSVEVFISSAKGGGEDRFVATAVNLSQGGIQIRCGREIVSSLLDLEVYPPECRLSFSGGKEQYRISVSARMVVNRRIAEDSHQLGFAFVGLDAKSSKILAEYLQQQ